MSKKNRLRKNFSFTEKKYFDIEPSFFNPISKLLKKNSEIEK